MSLEAMVWALKQAPVNDPIAQLVLIGLADHAGTDGCAAFPSQKTLAEYANTTTRTVRTKIAYLVEHGLIVEGDARLVEHIRADRRPNVFDLRMDMRRSRPEAVSGRKETENPATTGSATSPRPEAPRRHDRKLSSYEPSLEPSTKPSLPPVVPQDRFDEFWSIYPRRVGKRTASKAFASAVKRAEPGLILAGAARYAADPNRVDEFTAHPSTWLNRDGWDDEPLPPRAGRATRVDRMRDAIALGEQMQAALDEQDPPERWELAL